MGNPINLGCTINSPGFNVAGPTYFEDDATGTKFLYFTAAPVGASDVLFRIYVSTCTADLATCNTPNTWGPGVPVGTPTVAVPIDGLNSLSRNTRTAIRRRDGLEMILSSGRPGSLASENLWVSTRPAVTLDQKNWATPEPLNCDAKPGCSTWNPEGPLVNSDAFDGGPALSWDGTELYFFKVLPANNNVRTCTEGVAQEPLVTPDTGPFCRDLYVSKRTKLAGSN